MKICYNLAELWTAPGLGAVESGGTRCSGDGVHSLQGAANDQKYIHKTVKRSVTRTSCVDSFSSPHISLLSLSFFSRGQPLFSPVHFLHFPCPHGCSSLKHRGEDMGSGALPQQTTVSAQANCQSEHSGEQQSLALVLTTNNNQTHKTLSTIYLN